MTRSTWSVHDAKNRFSAMVEAAQQRPQTVTKHGRPAVVVVAARDYARLSEAERLGAPSFVTHLLAIPADGGALERLQGELRETDT